MVYCARKPVKEHKQTIIDSKYFIFIDAKIVFYVDIEPVS